MVYCLSRSEQFGGNCCWLKADEVNLLSQTAGRLYRCDELVPFKGYTAWPIIPFWGIVCCWNTVYLGNSTSIIRNLDYSDVKRQGRTGPAPYKFVSIIQNLDYSDSKWRWQTCLSYQGDSVYSIFTVFAMYRYNGILPILLEFYPFNSRVSWTIAWQQS